MSIKYNTNYDLTMPFSDDCAQLALAQNTNLAYTVPGIAGKRYSARITYASDSNVFCRLNAAATVPGAGLATEVPNEDFKPGYDGSQRYVTAGDTLNFITPDASAYVGVRLMLID